MVPAGLRSRAAGTGGTNRRLAWRTRAPGLDGNPPRVQEPSPAVPRLPRARSRSAPQPM